MNRSRSNFGRIANNYKVAIRGRKVGYRSKGFFEFRLIDTLIDTVIYSSGYRYRSHKEAMQAGQKLKEQFRRENDKAALSSNGRAW